MKHYCLATELPPRPTEPRRPPLPRAELWARCCEALDPRHRAAVQALMALDEPVSLAEDEDAHQAEHRAEHQAEGESPVDPAAPMRARLARARRLADEAGSELLRAWVAYDEALREALAARRAADLGRPWTAPAPDVDDRAAALAPMVAGLMSIADPQQRQRALDAARLRELDTMLVGDEFSTDAVVAQVVAALVVDRWDFDPEGDPDVDLEGEAPQEVWT